MDEARKTNDERHRAAVAAARAELDEAAQHAQQLARIEAEKVAWAGQHKVAEDVLARVRDELDRLVESEAFAPVVEALLKELLAGMRGEMVVLAPPRHAEQCRLWLREQGVDGATLESCPSLRDGVAVQDCEQTFRISNTLSGRLAKLEPTVRKLCAERLLNEAP